MLCSPEQQVAETFFALPPTPSLHRCSFFGSLEKKKFVPFFARFWFFDSETSNRFKVSSFLNYKGNWLYHGTQTEYLSQNVNAKSTVFFDPQI